MGVSLPNGVVLCRALGRYRMVVSADDESIGPNLILDGVWEPGVTLFLQRHIRPGMVCFDAGANLGYFTVLMGGLAAPGGRVLAAEPISESRRLLHRNITLNGMDATTQVFDHALGDGSGHARMVIPRGEPKNAHISQETAEGAWDGATVRIEPLDSLDLPVLDLIKIDVEGSEIALWNGMQRTIDRSPWIRIVMEVNAARYADPAGFLRRIEERFALQAIDPYGNAAPISIAQVIATPGDVMLHLARPQAAPARGV
jgi:FkbM family methyltransferase